MNGDPKVVPNTICVRCGRDFYTLLNGQFCSICGVGDEEITALAEAQAEARAEADEAREADEEITASLAAGDTSESAPEDGE